MATWNELRGLLDAGATIGSGVLGEPLSGLYGLGVAGANRLGLTDQTGAEGVLEAQEALQWEPRTREGRDYLESVGGTLEEVMNYQPPLSDRTIGEDLEYVGDLWRDRAVPGLQEAFGRELGSGIGALGLGVAGAVGLPARARTGARISTRFPTAVAATENPLTENLIIDTDAMRAGPRAFEKNMAAMSRYPQLSTRLRNPDRRADYFTGVLSDNLLDMYERIPEDVRDISKEWYVGANRFANTMADRYDQSPESVAGVIAALSPQKDWYMNASLAERMLDINANPGSFTPEMADTARRIFGGEQFSPDLEAVASKPYDELTPRQKAMFVRLRDEAHNYRGHRIMSPTGELQDFAQTGSGAHKKTGWGSLAEIGKGINVLEDPSIENISRQMGGMHKVRNFYNNIIDPSSDMGDVTIDTHAVAAGLLSPYSGSSVPVMHNFGGVGSSSFAGSGAKGTYGLYADAYRDAARQAGVLPREMQSITWEGVRGLFPAAFKQGRNIEDIEAIWDNYRRGDLTMDQAREAVYGRAGGISNPDWVSTGPGAGLAGGAPTSTYQRVLPESGILGSGGVDPGVGGNPARLSANESGFVDPRLLAWLAGLGGIGYLATRDPEEAEESNVGRLFKPREY